jgi:SAM-dependent methyltransferase
MVRLSRERVGEDENTRFMFRDARDLSCFREGEFDIVLFSCCGIDAVDHDDRQAIIRQVRRVLKPGGQFVFDVHNLSSYPPAPFTVPSTAPTKLHALYYAWKRRAFRRRLQKAMVESNMPAVRARGWGSLRDGAHGFSVSNFHIDPQLQLDETRAAGLEIVTIMDRDAQPILNVRSCTSSHVWFVTRRPPAA